ncbi:DUF3817 domain-containing protein [Angustibacter sp. Root456]|uniref:DUF3817 domain-containing protein n=1 Tax=Angustibacter sp. Root456 TaxID=1736539 RepID=UPI0007020ACB|nr:DUF3817 domain-containing protein [Angustibacter sp. Root456]KQX65978.1 hypothetical protein ASD06_06155 [Angustibacter sp. Root456]
MTPRVKSALTRFKIMAFVVGVGLLILCAEMVLHYGFDNDALTWWSPIHGVLYMLYLVATADLGLKVKWPLTKILGVALAGVVPFFSFIMERKVAREVEGRDADTLAA